MEMAESKSIELDYRRLPGLIAELQELSDKYENAYLEVLVTERYDEQNVEARVQWTRLETPEEAVHRERQEDLSKMYQIERERQQYFLLKAKYE